MSNINRAEQRLRTDMHAIRAEARKKSVVIKTGNLGRSHSSHRGD